MKIANADKNAFDEYDRQNLTLCDIKEIEAEQKKGIDDGQDFEYKGNEWDFEKSLRGKK